MNAVVEAAVGCLGTVGKEPLGSWPSGVPVFDGRPVGVFGWAAVVDVGRSLRNLECFYFIIFKVNAIMFKTKELG